MAKKKKEEVSEKDIQKRLSVLKASYEMYERSKVDTEKRRKSAKDKNGNRIYSDESLEETLELLNTMQDDVKDKYLELGGDVNDLYTSPKKGSGKGINRSKLESIMLKQKEDVMNEIDSEPFQNAEYDIKVLSNDVYEKEVEYDDDFDVTTLVDKDVKQNVHVEPKFPVNIDKTEIKTEEKVENKSTIGFSNINMDISKSTGNNIKYDVIPLPSGGKCYKHKIGKIPVAYLTAYDENMIMSPNLYQDGSFLDYIIKSKIMTTKIDTDELIPGDREAILIWLRASGYGPIYPITATDKTTGKEFKTNFDLTKLNYKRFNLIPDEDGNFEYVLPNTKDVIKFKYLSYKEIKELNEMTIKEDATLKKSKMLEIVESIEYYIENDDTMLTSDKNKLNGALKTIKEYADTIVTDDNTFFNHLVTNRLMKNIVSVNGVTDKNYITEYVTYLNIKDATALRRYINSNEPGVDMNITVERPESLGGGSIELFLTLDQFIFLNYS